MEWALGSNAWFNLTQNLAIGGLIAHTVLFWGPYVVKSFKQARTGTQPDRHWKASDLLSIVSKRRRTFPYRPCRSTRKRRGTGMRRFSYYLSLPVSVAVHSSLYYPYTLAVQA